MNKEPTLHYPIKEEKNEIDERVIDLLGSQFKFDHAKGLAEWIKNSVDAYRRPPALPDEKQHVVLRFTDGRGGNALLECVDFVGMTKEEIQGAFKVWFDPEASSRGIKHLKTYGGHGNGGKFYMRQMFRESYFVSYKDGKLNVYGFSPNKRYGFAPGYENIPVSPEEALRIAKLDDLAFPPGTKEKVLKGGGFTVVRGIGPDSMPNVVMAAMICNRLRNFPQASRILKRVPLRVIHNGKLFYNELRPDPITPKVGFESIEPIPVPETLETEIGGRRIEVELIKPPRYSQGELRLCTSDIAMERGGKYEELNRIDIIGELGVIASYHIQEIPTVGYLPQSVFIYGECQCPILEDIDSPSVQNDRVKLVENDRSRALLTWIGGEVKALAEKMQEKEKKENHDAEKDLSNFYNDFLNNWKNRFMSRVFSKILVGPGQGPGGGRGEGGSLGEIGSGKGNHGRSGGGEGEEDGGGDREKKGTKYPRVLISEVDPDPLSESGEPLILDPRHGVVYQRIQDVQEGIYWINYSAPLARSIREKYGTKSFRWRDYMLQRYIDILIKNALAKLEKQDPGMFTLNAVENTISRIATEAQEAALKDLGSFLFEEQFEQS